MATKKLQQHEIIELEHVVRKYVKRTGGFRKGISRLDKETAKKALAKLGRKTIEWDHKLNLHMTNYQSKVRPKTSKNSID